MRTITKLGSGIGVTVFAITNNALFYTISDTVPGFGIILGLGTGSFLDKRMRH